MRVEILTSTVVQARFISERSSSRATANDRSRGASELETRDQASTRFRDAETNEGRVIPLGKLTTHRDRLESYSLIKKKNISKRSTTL